MKEIVIWWVGQSDVRDDVVTEIFLQPTLGSAACVAWHSVPLPVVGSSNSHPLNTGQYYLLQVFDICLYVEYEAMWEDECRHNIAVISDYHKHHDVEWVFGFH